MVRATATRSAPALLAVAALAALALPGCAGWEDYDPPVQREIPEGRGLLSGDDGEFALELDLEAPAQDEQPAPGAEPESNGPSDDDGDQ